MDRIGPLRSILCTHHYRYLIVAALQLDIARTSYGCLRIDRRGANGHIRNRMVHNQVIGRGILVKCRRKCKALCTQAVQFTIRAAVHRRFGARRRRHIRIDRDLEIQRRILLLRCKSFRQNGSLCSSPVYIGHILMLVHIAALDIVFLQIQRVLARLHIVGPIELSPSGNRALRRSPWPAVAACLGRIPQSALYGSHAVRGISAHIKIVVISRISCIIAGNGVAAPVASLLLDDHRRDHIGADAGGLGRVHDRVRIADAGSRPGYRSAWCPARSTGRSPARSLAGT